MRFIFAKTTYGRTYNTGGAVAQAAVGAVVWARGGWPYLSLLLFILHAALAARAHKEVRRGHRQARRDRGDQGAVASGGTVADTGTLDTDAGAAVTGGASRPGVEGLPTRQSDEPIRAWKQARIELRNGTPTFAGVSRNGLSYAAQDVARCAAYWRPSSYYSTTARCPAHEFGPQLDCSCGFYALKDAVKPAEGIVLEVELYGTVIVCERGYRAERQRVLSVTLPAKCANALCNQSASLVTFIDDSLVGLCAEHAELAERSPLLTPAPVADLAGVLGTEVRFAHAVRAGGGGDGREAS